MNEGTAGAYRNARLWVSANGDYVKVTLKPGQVLTHCAGGRNEEGFGWYAQTWSHNGEAVVYRWDSWGADCDGRYSEGGESAAGLSHLDAVPDYGNEGLFLPYWEDPARFPFCLAA